MDDIKRETTPEPEVLKCRICSGPFDEGFTSHYEDDCIPYLLKQRTTLAAQLAEARAYADKLAQWLPMLPKDVELVNQANARMATELNDIENAVRSFCPIENSEQGVDDEPRAAFICCNDDADRIIEADTLAEAIGAAHGLWNATGEEVEMLRMQLADKQDQLSAAERVVERVRGLPRINVVTSMGRGYATEHDTDGDYMYAPDVIDIIEGLA